MYFFFSRFFQSDGKPVQWHERRRCLLLALQEAQFGCHRNARPWHPSGTIHLRRAAAERNQIPTFEPDEGVHGTGTDDSVQRKCGPCWVGAVCRPRWYFFQTEVAFFLCARASFFRIHALLVHKIPKDRRRFETAFQNFNKVNFDVYCSWLLAEYQLPLMIVTLIFHKLVPSETVDVLRWWLIRKYWWGNIGLHLISVRTLMGIVFCRRPTYNCAITCTSSKTNRSILSSPTATVSSSLCHLSSTVRTKSIRRRFGKKSVSAYFVSNFVLDRLRNNGFLWCHSMRVIYGGL